MVAWYFIRYAGTCLGHGAGAIGVCVINLLQNVPEKNSENRSLNEKRIALYLLDYSVQYMCLLREIASVIRPMLSLGMLLV